MVGQVTKHGHQTITVQYWLANNPGKYCIPVCRRGNILNIQQWFRCLQHWNWGIIKHTWRVKRIITRTKQVTVLSFVVISWLSSPQIGNAWCIFANSHALFCRLVSRKQTGFIETTTSTKQNCLKNIQSTVYENIMNDFGQPNIIIACHCKVSLHLLHIASARSGYRVHINNFTQSKNYRPVINLSYIGAEFEFRYSKSILKM